MQKFLHETFPKLLALFALLGLVLGGVADIFISSELASKIWGATIIVMLFPLGVQIISAIRQGGVGVDTVAFLSMLGAFLVGEYLAGAIVSLMYSGGDALDAYAAGRARSSLTELLRRAPQTANLRDSGGWKTLPAADIVPGDHLLVRTGDMVPVDGWLLGPATVNESLMTGESLPRQQATGELVRSGTSNAGAPFEIRAEKRARDSSYAALARLVENAEKERAPFVRMADKYSLWFLGITLLLSGLAWLISADPVRAVAVLVVATPCPLILAAPIALIGGIARMTKEGVVVKSGRAIETLGRTKTVLLDKTGTLTTGKPEIEKTHLLGDLSEDESLLIMASIDQVSSHVLARALVLEARKRGLDLQDPADVQETLGEGISAKINGKTFLVGSKIYMQNNGVFLPQQNLGQSEGQAAVFLAQGTELLSVFLLSDSLRTDAREMISSLRNVGLENIAMVTGDHHSVAEDIARETGLDQVYSEHTPAEKLGVVEQIRQNEKLSPVVMVGDGVNDAPALAAADVGIAMGSGGSTISAETADCVITVDRIDCVARAVELGRRTLRIAKESVLVGIGLSVIAMCVAALGYLPPVAGALLQEVIDIAVIVNALRVLR